MVRQIRVVVIDNKDSFTYNLVQLLGSLGAEPTVFINTSSLSEIQGANPTHLVISPGPGTPKDTGVSRSAILAYGGQIPVLGVCLGHQLIGEMFGAKVIKAPYPVHGKTSALSHTGKGVFRGLPQDVSVARYHSLVVATQNLPEVLEVTATSQGLIMGLRHRRIPRLEGVQFHPESYMTEMSDILLRNFLGTV